MVIENSGRCQPLAAAGHWSLVTVLAVDVSWPFFVQALNYPRNGVTSTSSTVALLLRKCLVNQRRWNESFRKHMLDVSPVATSKYSVFFTNQPKLAKYIIDGSLWQKTTEGGETCFLCGNPVRTFFWYI